MRLCFLSLLCLIGILPPAFAQPIGSWQEHLPFRSVTGLATGSGSIYAATPYACFSVDFANAAITRKSRINGLSETGVQTIYGTPSGQLLVVYRNSNLDLIAGSQITNINALQLKSINADKTVYAVSGDEESCWLATGFGVVVLNLAKQEIGDSWILGNGGAYSKVNAVEKAAGNFYAATAEGLKKAPATGSNLADYRNWINLSGTNGLPATAPSQVLASHDTVLVRLGNSLYSGVGDQFSLLYADEWEWSGVNLSNGQLLIEQRLNGQAAVLQLSTGGQFLQRLVDPLVTAPAAALWGGNSLWIADSAQGLLELSQQGLHPVIPNSPYSLGTGGLAANRNQWWAATGDALSQFSEGQWTVYPPGAQGMPAAFAGAGPVLISRTGTVWAGSNNGLLNWKDGQFGLSTAGLSPAMDNPAQFRVSGLAEDASQQLWICNDGASNGLVLRKQDGNFQQFTIPFQYAGNRLGAVVIDDLDQKWMLSPGNGLFCFNQGGSLENSGDDQWRFYQYGSGNGNLPSNTVLSIAKDAFGFIWVGTDDGIGLIQCTEQVFSGQGCEAVLPVVQTDQFAGYLFKGEAVQAIAVDGANRKWIGTRNGVWLLSADGDKTILRFTSTNSPLLDNNVQAIAIDPFDGTVIFSTASGICSYRSDATAGGARNEKLLVFPNPVPPGYTGSIAIRGLVNNAIVKIVELGGRLVVQGRAAGGQFTWNGRDANGKKIATGIYLVYASDDSRKEQAAAKIIFIQR